MSGIEGSEAQETCPDDEEEEDQLQYQVPPQLMCEFEAVEEVRARGFAGPDLLT